MLPVLSQDRDKNFDYFSYNMSCVQYLQDQDQLNNKPQASALVWIQVILCFGLL